MLGRDQDVSIAVDLLKFMAPVLFVIVVIAVTVWATRH
jgi:hypothetical protein